MLPYFWPESNKNWCAQGVLITVFDQSDVQRLLKKLSSLVLSVSFLKITLGALFSKVRTIKKKMQLFQKCSLFDTAPLFWCWNLPAAAEPIQNTSIISKHCSKIDLKLLKTISYLFVCLFLWTPSSEENWVSLMGFSLTSGAGVGPEVTDYNPGQSWDTNKLPTS